MQPSKPHSFEDFASSPGVDPAVIQAHIIIVNAIGQYAADKSSRLVALVNQAEAMRVRIAELTKQNDLLAKQNDLLTKQNYDLKNERLRWLMAQADAHEKQTSIEQGTPDEKAGTDTHNNREVDDPTRASGNGGSSP